ncbi:unnamed protein product [Ixodes hexagonus]
MGRQEECRQLLPEDEPKPLLAPKRRQRGQLHARVLRARGPHSTLGYGALALAATLAVVGLATFVVRALLPRPTPEPPCPQVEYIWHRTLPMLTTETAFRHLDVNQDGVQDVVFAFGTGADALLYPRVVCAVYFPGSEWCGGGVAALNGLTGEEMWRLYVAHELFALTCRADLDGDGIWDCVAGGRMAGLYAVSGRTGALIWSVSRGTRALVNESNMYTAQFIRDVDADGVPDLVVAHGGDPLKEPGSEVRLPGRLLVVSGRSGRVLRWALVPDHRESYYSPQLLHQPDGSEVLLFGTGGETHGGSLWRLRLRDLLDGRMSRARALYTDPDKGVMTPPALVDVTGDGVADVVSAMFNSTVVALDGVTFRRLWTHRFPGSESYSTPAVGFFNADDTPDVLVTYQTGPGFPVYFYTQTTVLDGRTGRPLLGRPLRAAVGTQASPLAVSREGRGRDLFLYWLSDCHGAHRPLPFHFVQGTSVFQQSRADFCRLRFKDALFTRLYAISSATGPPGVLVYDSDDKRDLEYAGLPNFTAIGSRFLKEHPGYARGSSLDHRPTGSLPRYRSEDVPLRKRRHVGPHDGGGVQRTISTGTLLPSLGPHAAGSIDLAFATFWFHPSSARVLSPAERRCLEALHDQEDQRFLPQSPLFGMDHDAYEALAASQCLEGGDLPEDSYDPFDRPMGQMTVYRVRLGCPHVLPFERQRWPAYMGAQADSYARP